MCMRLPVNIQTLLTVVVFSLQLPSSLAWHPGGTIVFAASSRGDIQVKYRWKSVKVSSIVMYLS